MYGLMLEYVKPELLVVAIVIYLIGSVLKNLETIKDKFIPLVLGCISIALCTMYLLAVTPGIDSIQAIMKILFSGIIQGILCAALSTYTNQMIKQMGKNE